MHQRTQRRVGRWLFLAICILPTVAVVAWALAVNRSGYTDAWEAELSDCLGVHVAVERATQPRPGTTLLKNLLISDPETHKRIARVRLVEIVKGDDATTLVFSQPQVEPGQLARVWQTLHRQIIHLGGLPSRTTQLEMSELTCGDGQKALTLTGVRGRIETTDAGRVATVEFRIAGQDMSQPAEARLLRTRHNGEAFTRVEFHTGGSELPCALFSPYSPWLDQVGPDCHFRGSFTAAQRRDGWEGEVAGRLTRLDLDRLVGAHFPHKLSGRADVELRKLHLQGGRVRSAEGSFSAGPGVLSRSLIHAMSDSGLAEEVETAGRLADTLIAFEHFAFTFDVGDEGMSVFGACENETPGALLTRDGQALLVQPREPSLPAVALVRCLVPESRVQVPATRETDILLRVLPIPSLQPPVGGRQAHSRIRFGGESERH
jgi:hypothetical protein